MRVMDRTEKIIDFKVTLLPNSEKVRRKNINYSAINFLYVADRKEK